jgi:hypothetical protein
MRAAYQGDDTGGPQRPSCSNLSDAGVSREFITTAYSVARRKLCEDATTYASPGDWLVGSRGPG